MSLGCPFCQAGVNCPHHTAPYRASASHQPLELSTEYGDARYQPYPGGPLGPESGYYSGYPISIPLRQPPGATIPVYSNPGPFAPMPAGSNPFDPRAQPPPSIPPQAPRKRAISSNAAKATKRSRKAAGEATDAGVGPSRRNANNRPSQEDIAAASVAAASIPPSYTPDENKPPGGSNADNGRAIEVWFHVIGTAYETTPSLAAIESARARAHEYQTRMDPANFCRPLPASEFPRLLCIPCLNQGRWKTYSNGGTGGHTSSLRPHLESVHPTEFNDGCRQLGTSKKIVDDTDDVLRQPVTTEGMAQYIAELVAEQDLSFNFSESRTFRRLLCYVGQGNIQSIDLPKRQVVAKTAAMLSREAQERIKEEMKNCPGRISTTSDLWTDDMEHPFMAMTGHFISRSQVSVVVLLAFRFIETSHSGLNLSDCFFKVLEEYDIVHKLGSITLDNAANNDKMMSELQKRLAAEGYGFDHDGNRIRCFPHIINLAVGAFLAGLDQCSSAYRQLRHDRGEVPSQDTEQYLSALEKRPDKRCQDLVVALRNGQRKRGLQQTIHEGNEKTFWKTKKPVVKDGVATGEVVEEPLKLKQLHTVHSVKTRWSSVRNMIARFIYLYPAITTYIDKNSEVLADYTVTHLQFKVLQDIQAVLDIFHRAQELLSADQTPCLSLAFPVYNILIISLRKLALQFPALAYAINSAVTKLEEYIDKSRSSPIHILAMFLNPAMKYTWIDKHWSNEEQQNARKVVKRYMLMYLEAKESRLDRLEEEEMKTAASRAQKRGVDNLLYSDRQVEYAFNVGSSAGGVTPTASPVVARTSSVHPLSPSPSSRTITNTPSKTLARRMEDVEREHDRYIGQGTWEDIGGIDLVKHWNTQGTVFPLLHPISMDVLPAQASSVSSERVFSSSKLTCTRARNKIGVQTVELLQILKYSLRHRLPRSSSNNLQPDDDDFDIRDVSQTVDLMRRPDSDWDDDAILDGS